MSEVLCNLSGFGGSGSGGGGFELGNPSGIAFTNKDEEASIVWTDPDDVVVDGQTLARWAGTLVVRKVGSRPTSKTDGTIVIDSKTRDAYKTNGYSDTGLTNGTKYYYGIFPYTSQNVYNYTSVTEFTPTAILPTAVSDLAATSGDEVGNITWSQPTDNTSVTIMITATGEEDRTFANATSPIALTNLTNDVTYSIKAISYNAKNRTADSNVVTITPRAVYPSAVTDLAASSGDETGTVTWTKPSDATSVTIKITAPSEEDRTYANATSPLNLTNLTNDVVYTIKAVTYNAKGRTTDSATVTIEPGSIPPSVVTGLTVTGGDETATITWDGTPEDATSVTILVTASGEADRSKPNATSPLVLSDLTNDVTYSVKAISHNAKGRTAETAVVTVKPTAIYPTAVTDLAASGQDEGAKITWTTPSDATSVTITITASGESDRTYTSATSPLEVTGLTNKTEYTVKATTYNAKGRSKDSSTITVTPSGIKIYGFTQNFSDTNPDTCISYPSDVENANYAKMMTNEGTGTVTYGGWKEFLEEVLKNKPYMVKSNGEADYELSSSDYTKKADGTASDVSNANYSGAGAFAWLNKVYTRTIYNTKSNTRTVYIAVGGKPTVPEGSAGYDPDGFRDSNGNELEGVWIPMFYQNASNSKTIANASYAKSLTTDQQRSKIESVNSTRAKFLGLPIVHILRDLEYMLFKSTDIQKNAGHGNCNGGSESALKHNPIVANGSVVGWKGTSDKRTANKYFHSMVLGTYDQWLRDPYTQLRNGVLYVSENYNENSMAEAIDLQGNAVSFTTSSAWTYPCTMMGLKNLVGGFYKQESTGSQTTGSCDGQYFNASSTRVALRVGDCSDDLVDGPASLYLGYGASYAGWNRGAAVLLLPPAGYAPA